jgi:hypothetical protein
VAAKALIAAADLIQTLMTSLTLQYFRWLRSLWFSIATNQTSKLS